MSYGTYITSIVCSFAIGTWMEFMGSKAIET